MLSTAFTRRLGIRHPLIQAGMGHEAGGILAAAVSNAGALGTIGSIGAGPDQLLAQIGVCRSLVQAPFAVNVVTWPWAPFADALLDVALEAKVPVVTLSFGNPLPALERCRAAGRTVLVQVQDLAGARAALAARPDALIVQGNEAGGHTGRRGTLGFAAQVLDLAGDVPVVVAGGIATGRGLAAALAMGAAGAVVGTRFKATVEFAGPHPLKEALVASDGENTRYDEIWDEACGLEWPNRVTGRALENRFTAEWAARRDQLRAKVASMAPFAFLAELTQDPTTHVNWAGESAGMVTGIVMAAQIVEEVTHDAERLLRGVAAVVD